MLIIDDEGTVKNRKKFSARTAGILGFSMFGTDKLFCLDDQMELKYFEILQFLDKHKGEKYFFLDLLI